MANRSLVVPECSKALEQMKYEVAAELGVPVFRNAAGADAEFASELGSAPVAAPKPYYGELTAREAGSLGGGITRRLVQMGETNANGM